MYNFDLPFVCINFLMVIMNILPVNLKKYLVQLRDTTIFKINLYLSNSFAKDPDLTRNTPSLIKY